MEPGPRLPGVRHLLHSRFPARHRRRRRLERHGRHGRGPRDHRRRVPPHLPGSAAGLSLRLRRQHERAAAEAARRSSSRSCSRWSTSAPRWPKPTASASPSATRKCGSASSRCRRSRRTARFIGEQRYQQLLRMQRPPMTASEFEDNVRRSLTVDKLRSLAHRLAVGRRQGARAGVPPPQRQGEARRRQLHRRQLPAAGHRDRRRGREPISTRTRTTSRFPRSARSATC